MRGYYPRRSSEGADRNRTGVNGFAGRCVATPPRRRSGSQSRTCSCVPVRREARVDLALALRQRVDVRALLVAEAEVEDVEVLDAPLVARGLRDRAHLRLVEQPAQRDLARCLAVRLGDLVEGR